MRSGVAGDDLLRHPSAVVGQQVERGVDANSGDILVEVDPRYFRPTEVDVLQGDAAKARAALGWEHVTGFEDLVREMVEADLVTVKNEAVTGRENRHE